MPTGKPEAARAGRGTLPPATLTHPPVPRVQADGYLAQKNWGALQTNLAQPNGSDSDRRRRARRARAFKEQHLTSSAKTEWIEALRATCAWRIRNINGRNAYPAPFAAVLRLPTMPELQLPGIGLKSALRRRDLRVNWFRELSDGGSGIGKRACAVLRS